MEYEEVTFICYGCKKEEAVVLVPSNLVHGVLTWICLKCPTKGTIEYSREENSIGETTEIFRELGEGDDKIH